MPRPTDLDEYDSRVWALGQQRLKVVAALAAAERTDKKSIEAAAWELGVSRAYCYRLLRRYRDNPSATPLMPRSRGRVAGHRVLDPAVDTVVELAIDEFYLTPERPTMSALVREVARRCGRKELKAPTYKAVLTRVRARKLRDVLKKREGAARARAKTARVVGHLASDGPFALVQIDHTLADVIVVAEGSRLPIGRPWLTLAIDVATHAPDPVAKDAAGTALYDYNLALTDIADRRPIAAIAADPDSGAVLGGLWGRTELGLLFLDMFFLPETLRGQDLGSRLLDQVEAEAQRRSCRRAVVETSSFQAPGFYLRHGYTEFGRVPFDVPGQARVFFSKTFAPAAGKDGS